MSKKTYDVAIIGGGVIGTTTAFYLAELGHKVILIDPELDKPLKKNIGIYPMVQTIIFFLTKLKKKISKKDLKI